MNRVCYIGILVVFVLLMGTSGASAQYRTVQRCVEVKASEINREISRLKSKCNNEMRYINTCIRNPDRARGSRDRSRSKGDWYKLKKELKSRCERELADLNRQKTQVWRFCKDSVGVEAVTDLLGSVWETVEAGIGGVWKRRGESNVFDGKWDDGAVAELTITLSGNDVRIERNDLRGPNAGQMVHYTGTISADGKTADGTFISMAGEAPWSATITH